MAHRIMSKLNACSSGRRVVTAVGRFKQALENSRSVTPYEATGTEGSANYVARTPSPTTARK